MSSIRLVFVIILSLLIACVLEILPYPPAMIWIKPDWVALVFIFWLICAPDYVGIAYALFLMGLCMDLLMGTLLGAHAIVFLIMAYCLLRFNIRIYFFSFLETILPDRLSDYLASRLHLLGE